MSNTITDVKALAREACGCWQCKDEREFEFVSDYCARERIERALLKYGEMVREEDAKVAEDAYNSVDCPAHLRGGILTAIGILIAAAIRARKPADTEEAKDKAIKAMFPPELDGDGDTEEGA